MLLVMIIIEFMGEVAVWKIFQGDLICFDDFLVLLGYEFEQDIKNKTIRIKVYHLLSLLS